MKTLRQIFDEHECDKGSMRHRYDRVYEPALQHLRNEKFNMLEVGIFKGKSLESWVEYFPNATLYGIDIFKRVKSSEVPILRHPRVKWCKCNSIIGPNPAFNKLVGNKRFKVIIDDGLHTHDSQRCTFTNFIPFLEEGGIYFIEDVWPYDRMTLQQKKHRWMVKNKQHYSKEQYRNLLKAIERYDVEFHDIRNGYELDTFMIEVRK